MEIGTEISRKIRGAIKGKLEELGAYIDEELPDYIMVMVANKKSQEQMTDDLSLFLGSSTIKFTVWLHGVLEKLRSATSDPNSQKSTDAIIFESSMSSCKTMPNVSNPGFPDEPHLAISRSTAECPDPQVSTSSQGQSNSLIGHHSDESSAARPTSAVKPLRDFAPSEAIIDIQPNADDLIDEDLNFVSENPVLPQEAPTTLATHGSSRPTAALYRPPGSSSIHYYQVPDLVAHSQRLPQSSVQSVTPVEVQSCRPMETIKQYGSEAYSTIADTHRHPLKTAFERATHEEESFLKRKLPSVSSVVKVKSVSYDGEEEEEEEEDYDHGSRTTGLSSSVSVPAKPERRPTLPPSKQANKNLILKAISEAQKSVSKTTNYFTAPQKQTVPVAPRTRLIQNDSVIQLIHAQVAPSRIGSLTQTEPARTSSLTTMELTSSGSLVQMESTREYGLKRVADVYDVSQSYDSRSFILKRPKLSDEIVTQKQLFTNVAEDVTEGPGRIIQSRDPQRSEKLENPKFIVTLDGVPSPPGYASDQEEEMEVIEEGDQISTENSKPLFRKQNKLQAMQRISGKPMNSDGEDVSAPVKKMVHERCKYWPACKNGDTCIYHHPTTPCKMFPKCKFAEKCLFIHPNCKYDAKCSKPDCPYTHASRRNIIPTLKPDAAAAGPMTYCRYDVQCTKPDCPYIHARQLLPLPPAMPAPVLAPSAAVMICKFFPSCKKMECPFYHPKLCRYNTQCHRPDCTFYHPSSIVPPRHALKWTRAQTSE